MIATFLLVGVQGIGRPGLLYDEVLFVNASLGGLNETFIHLRVWGVPVLLMAYIGALKAWLYAPVFWIWGVSPESIRIPALLLFAASLYVNARLASMLFGRFLGLVFLLALATDPALFFASRLDLGPNAMMSLMKALGLLLLFRWIRSPSNRLLAGLLLVLGLGVFDKLNFAWFVIGLATAALTFSRRLRQGLIAGAPGSWVLLSVPTAIGLYVAVTSVLPLLFHYETGHEQESVLSMARWDYVSTWAWLTLTGEALRMILFDQPPIPAAPWSGLLAGLLTASLLTISRRTFEVDEIPTSAWPIVLFFVALSTTVLVLILVTPQATRPHYMLALHPDGYFLAVALFAAVAGSVQTSWKRPVASGVIAIATLVVVLNVQRSAEYLDRTRSADAFLDWASPAIYSLAQRVQELDPDVIVSSQWGLHNQLFALAPPEKRRRYHDHWIFFSRPEAAEAGEMNRLFEEDYRGRRTLTVAHASEADGIRLPGDRANFLAFRREVLGQHAAPEVVLGPQGDPLYELYLSPPIPDPPRG
ncbi:MAG: glycosyltransferase family 39 protein [Candidatus Binatia bacterium]|nr:glycosyltransferase family 39 protein [Candidatus Binatia bacterium]